MQFNFSHMCIKLAFLGMAKWHFVRKCKHVKSTLRVAWGKGSTHCRGIEGGRGDLASKT